MSSEEIRQSLAGVEFFADLDEDVLAFLVECARERRFARDQTLFRQGDPATEFFLLQSGSVSIEIPAIAGPVLEVQHLGPGRILGWSWLLPPYKWSFQARAEEDATALAFNGSRVLAKCEDDPRFGYVLIKRFSALMAERLEAAHRRMMAQWSPAGFA